jgi:hypothetical protein
MLLAYQNRTFCCHLHSCNSRAPVRVHLARASSSSSAGLQEQQQQQQPPVALHTGAVENTSESNTASDLTVSRGAGAKRWHKWQQRKKQQAAAAAPGPASIPRNCHNTEAVCSYLLQHHRDVDPAFWVKAVVHLVRLVSAGQQVQQTGWQQLRECLLYLAAAQQQQQQQQQGQKLLENQQQQEVEQQSQGKAGHWSGSIRRSAEPMQHYCLVCVRHGCLAAYGQLRLRSSGLTLQEHQQRSWQCKAIQQKCVPPVLFQERVVVVTM